MVLKQEEADYNPGARLGMNMSNPGFSSVALNASHGDTSQNEWDEDVADFEVNLREAREAERQKRLADHQQRSKEKERKKSSGIKSNFAATKLS